MVDLPQVKPGLPAGAEESRWTGPVRYRHPSRSNHFRHCPTLAGGTRLALVEAVVLLAHERVPSSQHKRVVQLSLHSAIA
jgi:hypothetical protein